MTRTRAVLAGTTAIGAACLAMGSAQVVVQLVLGAIVCGVAVGLLNAATGALVVTRTPEQVRGRVLAGLNGSARTFSVAALVWVVRPGTGSAPAARSCSPARAAWW